MKDKKLEIGPYIISHDGYQWAVNIEVERRKEGPNGQTTRLKGLSYHATLQQACEALIDMSIDAQDMASVNALINCINESTAIIADHIKGVSA